MSQSTDPRDPGAVVIEPSARHRASVIWLHGLGADGNDFVPAVPLLGLPEASGVRFVFPHAPVRPVTINGGMAMRAWFDLRDLDLARPAAWDLEGARHSAERLERLVAAEVARGLERSRVVVAGFSQGGTVAVEYLLQAGAGLAGVVTLSSFHPAALGALAPAPPDAAPVFAAHGAEDTLIACRLGEVTGTALAEAGYRVQWHRYPTGHGVCVEELRDLGRWLMACLGD